MHYLELVIIVVSQVSHYCCFPCLEFPVMVALLVSNYH